MNTGHHTSELKRKIEQKAESTHTIVVIDEIRFLLENDGDGLLYYLSRTQNISTVVISLDAKVLETQLEERTQSSFRPQKIGFEPLDDSRHYQALHRRAQDGLKKQTVQKSALEHIVSETSNMGISLHWLRTAAETASNLVYKSTVEEARSKAIQNYVEERLTDFTKHHLLLYRLIRESSTKQDVTQSGEIYQRYQQFCRDRSMSSLSKRRISTYLKHLELLHLIEVQYHYGGQTGKTREIRMRGI